MASLSISTRCAVALGLIAGLALTAVFPSLAWAEREDDEPMFQRLAQQYLTLLKPQTTEPYERGFHAGGFVSYTNRVFWREFFLQDRDLNLHLGGFVQFAGARIEGYGTFSDPFSPGRELSRPTYWEINASYMLQVDRSFLVAGFRRNNFSTLDDRESKGFPLFLDEVFFKIIAIPSPLQDQVNLLYTVALHQRISGGKDGLLIDVGFQTMSTNAWILGDVLSFGAKVTWNHRYLTPYGRFSYYELTAKLWKDISNINDPGRGPIWAELFLSWHGALSSRLKDEFLVTVSIWVSA